MPMSPQYPPPPWDQVREVMLIWTNARNDGEDDE